MLADENDLMVRREAKTAAPFSDPADKKRTRRLVGVEFVAIALATPPLLAISYEWLVQTIGSDGAIVAFLTLVFTGLVLSIAGSMLLKRVWWMPVLFGIAFATDLAGCLLWFFLRNLRV